MQLGPFAGIGKGQSRIKSVNITKHLVISSLSCVIHTYMAVGSDSMIAEYVVYRSAALVDLWFKVFYRVH